MIMMSVRLVQQIHAFPALVHLSALNAKVDILCQLAIPKEFA
jgi:hypothetical protein